MKKNVAKNRRPHGLGTLPSEHSSISSSWSQNVNCWRWVLDKWHADLVYRHDGVDF